MSSSWADVVGAVEKTVPSDARADEVPDSELWYDAYDRLFHNKRQRRPVKISTACDGINAPIFALKVLRIMFEHIYGSEPKYTAQRFTAASGTVAEHHFKDAEDGANSKGHCIVHKKECSIPMDAEDIHISGPKCQLYSDLNNERQSDFEAIKQHDDFSAVKSFVKTLAKRRPRIAIMENVIGMMKKRQGSEKSFLMEIIAMTEVEAPEYAVVTITGCASKWLPGTRERLYIIFTRAGEGTAMDLANEVQHFCDRHMQGSINIRQMTLQDCLLDEEKPLLKRRINEKKATL